MSDAVKVKESSDQRALRRTLGKINLLGLNDHLSELETRGYTTIKGVLTEDRIRRAKEAILDRVEQMTGKRIDPTTATEDDYQGMSYLPYLLYDNEVFEEILLEEKPLALINYLLGESCVLSSLGCHFKGPGENGVLPLHSDNAGPTPFPPYSLVSNVNYALTPYSRKAGALAMVPGSHKFATRPNTSQMSLSGDSCNPSALPMDLDPGDCVVWHGSTWHGSFARQIPGIRMNLAVYFARPSVVTQEKHKNSVPLEVLNRHASDPRFSALLAGNQAYGWQGEGPDYGMMAKMPRGIYD
jgi:ectoine hydroxylase-related dioxygenase (phytanoyl-CoA dioxygenase family)